MKAFLPVSIMVKLVIAWLVLSVLAYWYGPQFLSFLLPFSNWVITLIQKDYLPALTLAGNETVSLTATMIRPVPGVAGVGAQVTAGAHVPHVLVPFVLLISGLALMPLKSIKNRILTVLYTFCSLILIAALILPFQLTGKIDIMFLEYARHYGVHRDESLRVKWMLFLEMGGRWVLPIALAGIGLVMGGAFNELNGAQPESE